MSAFHFRPARAEDADAIVPLMYESSRGLIDACFRFGDAGPEPFLRCDFLRGDGIFGYRQQMVAIADDGQLVATMTVYRGRDINRLSLQTLRSAFIAFGWGRFLRVLWRSLALASLFVTPRRDSLFLANGCVVANRRSQGLFAAFIEHVCTSSDSSLTVAEFDVSFGNPRAQKLYERLGFVVVSERAYRGRRALDGFRRMQRALTRPPLTSAAT